MKFTVYPRKRNGLNIVEAVVGNSTIEVITNNYGNGYVNRKPYFIDNDLWHEILAESEKHKILT